MALIANGKNKYKQVNASGEQFDIGSATNSFTPLMRFSKWNLESFVELNLIGGGNVASFKNSSISNGVVTVENDWFILAYKTVGLKPPHNDVDGLDYVITLKKKPSLNIITFTYNHQACNAYLQPPLTQDEIDEGCVRPDYVVNSIAFYHDTKGGVVKEGEPYKTGKIGHLYSMLATDSSATPKTAWTSWGFGGGQSQITLSLPQAFIDTATYPVTIAPVGDTFGYTTAGGSAGAIGVYGPYRSSYSCGAAGSGTSMTYYVGAVSLNKTLKLKAAIYSGANVIANGVTGEVEQYFDAGNKGWVTSNFGTSPSLSAASYWLALAEGNGTDGSTAIYYDAGSADQSARDTTSYASVFPDPWSNDATYSRQFSIYCTYTPSGGGGWAHLTEINGLSTTAVLTEYYGVALANISEIYGVAV